MPFTPEGFPPVHARTLYLRPCSSRNILAGEGLSTWRSPRRGAAMSTPPIERARAPLRKPSLWPSRVREEITSTVTSPSCQPVPFFKSLRPSHGPDADNRATVFSMRFIPGGGRTPAEPGRRRTPYVPQVGRRFRAKTPVAFGSAQGLRCRRSQTRRRNHHHGTR